MTGRADAIKRALALEAARHAASWDVAEDLGAVTITLKIQAGTSWVRGVTYTEERVLRQDYRSAVPSK